MTVTEHEPAAEPEPGQAAEAAEEAEGGEKAPAGAARTPSTSRGRLPALMARLRRPEVVLAGVVALVAIVVGYRSRPVIFHDDAAITARYVHNIANGDGWVYNVGDRTNGASAPLYTMGLVAMHLVGIDIIDAAGILCLAGYAASIGLVAYLAARIAGLFAGAAAGLLLGAWVDFASQGLSGMESAVSAALGLAAIAALLHGRDTWAGVLLGLALLNKLDAGLLAVAIAVAYVAVLRRPPWRIAAVSAAVLAPWLLFSVVYFGSPLPNSFTQKVGDIRNPATSFDQTWIVDVFDRSGTTPIVVVAIAAVAAVPLLRRRSPRAAVALVVALGWPALHGLAFSLVDLGDAYPWYLTVLYPPLALAAGCALGFVVTHVRALSLRSGFAAAVACSLAIGVATGVHSNGNGGPGEMARRVRFGHTTADYLRFEQARREAGRRVAELAEPGDVIQTCFGWIAYEAREHLIDETCPLSTRKEVPPAAWAVSGVFPGFEPSFPEGVTILETVMAEGQTGGRMDIVDLRGQP